MAQHLTQNSMHPSNLPGAGLFHLPGYQLHEYQLVLALPDALKERLKKVRQQFQETYQTAPQGQSPILLPLVKFRQRPVLEERMVLSLQQVVSSWKPVALHLKDFGSAPAHSIYIPVTSPLPLQSMVRGLKGVQSLLKADRENQPHFPDEHRVFVASRIPRQVYENAWLAYSHKKFTGQFMADACLLLKRKTGSQYWQILRRMEFRNLPLGVSQGSLFA